MARLNLATIPTASPSIEHTAPEAILFSSHPDDEVIVGALALRLMRELGFRAVNVAVTLGSAVDQKERRRMELARACSYLGFGLEIAGGDSGLDQVTPKSKSDGGDEWGRKVEVVVAILRRYQPIIVFFPHSQDFNLTHIGTHYLVTDALAQMGNDFRCHCFETEFWQPMDGRGDKAPNILVEISNENLAELMYALTFHAGEIARNPYHLTLPAWMEDNVRRGAEVVGNAQGGFAPNFQWGMLYRHTLWENGKQVAQKPRHLPKDSPLLPLFD